MIGAHDSDPARVLRRWVVEGGSRGESTIIGSGYRVATDKAALVNGTMVRYLDANDIMLEPGGRGGHFSDATPSLLAMAEKHGRSADEFVTCVVASYELQAALNRVFPFMSRAFTLLHRLPGWPRFCWSGLRVVLGHRRCMRPDSREPQGWYLTRGLNLLKIFPG